jgi:hypothetical protein
LVYAQTFFPSLANKILAGQNIFELLQNFKSPSSPKRVGDLLKEYTLG